MKKFTICGIQIETGDDCRKNLEKSFSLCRSACIQHPDFIVLPEMFEIVPKPHRAAGYSHLIPSEITETLAGIAKEHSVNIIGGSFLENEGTRVYNTCCVFNRKGQLCGKYRKMHLFDAFGYNESTSISKGNSPLLCEFDGLKFGVAICYDIRFPELFRHYALSGAHIVFVPSAFFQPNHDHWVLSIRSRALDNTIFVIGCNQTGKPFVGRSMMADPWGISASSMGVEEGIFTSLIDLDIISKTRDKLPLLANRRYDVSIRDSV